MATTSVPTAVILDPVTIAQFTTAFKAPESCNTIVWACTRNTGQTMFYCWPERDSRCNSDGWHGPAASCYPDGERFIEIRSRSVIPVYSPAQQCPEGWGPALSYSTTAGHTTETVSCCPSGYFAGNDNCRTTFPTLLPSATLHVCEGTSTTTIVVTSAAAETRGYVRTGENLIVSTFWYIEATGNPVVLVGRNLNTFSPQSSSRSTGTSGGTSDGEPTRLSTGAKAGIGVGAAFLATLLLVSIIFLVLRRGRDKSNPSTSAPTSTTPPHALEPYPGKPELEGNVGASPSGLAYPKAELPSHNMEAIPQLGSGARDEHAAIGGATELHGQGSHIRELHEQDAHISELANNDKRAETEIDSGATSRERQNTSPRSTTEPWSWTEYKA